jgi:hypothetical protein
VSSDNFDIYKQLFIDFPFNNNTKAGWRASAVIEIVED